MYGEIAFPWASILTTIDILASTLFTLFFFLLSNCIS